MEIIELTIKGISTFFTNTTSTFEIRHFIDIGILSLAIYKILWILRTSSQGRVLRGIFILLVGLYLSWACHLYAINYLLSNALEWGIVVLVVIFQPEIRRFLERMGSSTLGINFMNNNEESTADIMSAIENTVSASKVLSEEKIGALMVFTRTDFLEDLTETGWSVNSDLTSNLLQMLFRDKSLMHDGAVIIRKKRILGAGCILPNSNNSNLSKELGLRHRAGVGVSEHSDAVVVIISEETGSISVAVGGQLKRHISSETLGQILSNELLIEPKKDKKSSTLSKFFIQSISKRKNISKPLPSFTSKPLYMIISLFAAFAFWFYVIDVEDPEQSYTFRGIPIVISGENILENQNLTITKLSQETINLDIKAPRSTLNALQSSGILVSLDVSKISATGEYSLSYSTSYPNNVNTSTLIVEQRTPNQIAVEVGRLYSETYPIGMVMRGSVAEGYQAGQHIASPEIVTLSGPMESVSKVKRVVVILEQENLSERFTENLPLVLLDANDEEIIDPNIDMSETTAYVTLPIVMEREIPLVVNFSSGGGATEADIQKISIVPSTITVSGEEDDMIGLVEISLGSVDLSLVGEEKAFTFPIALDSSLVNVSGISEAMVTVSISGLATKPFDVSNIELINIPDGYTASTSTQMRTVVVRGREEDLEMIDPSQLRIVADLSNNTVSGSTSIPVKVYLDSAGDVGVTGEYSIVVNVSKT